MNAIIDIKTPAGQSLEGFPETFSLDLEAYGNGAYGILNDCCSNADGLQSNPLLHKGDKITIEIL